MNHTIAESPGIEIPLAGKRSKSKWFISLFLFLIFLIFVGLYFGPAVFLEAKAQAKKEYAKANALQIGQAVTSYYYDHNALPVPSDTPPTPGGIVFSTDTPEGLEVVNLLAGSNPRKVKYMVFKEASGNKDGAVHDSSGSRITALYDPWGNPYKIAVDTGLDQKLVIPFKVPVFVNGKRCAVYSAGQDGVLETKDDVKTW